MYTTQSETPQTVAVCPSCSSEYIFFTSPFFLNSRVLGVTWLIANPIRLASVLFVAGLFRKASKIIVCLGAKLSIIAS